MSSKLKSKCIICQHDITTFCTRYSEQPYTKDMVYWKKKATGEVVTYSKCTSCDFVYTEYFNKFTEIDFANRVYNDVYHREVDPDYNFKRPTIMAAAIGITAKFLGFRKIIDYGGGNGSTAQKLNRFGIEAKSFDRYGLQDDLKLFDPDLATMVEVLEHSNDPLGLFNELNSLLEKKIETVFFTTKLAGSDVNSTYIAPRNGHISIFNKTSLKKLASKLGYSHFSVRNSHIFYSQNFIRAYIFIIMQEIIKIIYAYFVYPIIKKSEERPQSD